MLRFIFLLLFSCTCYGSEQVVEIQERSAREYIFGKKTATWGELIEGDKEPESLVESVILGAKLGLFVVSPISASVNFISVGSFTSSAKVFAGTFLGSIVFVGSFWVLGEIGKKLGIYHGLDNDDLEPTREKIIIYINDDAG